MCLKNKLREQYFTFFNFRFCLCVCVSVCVAVCLCVCLSVFLSVQDITFELIQIETSFLVCRHVFTISRSGLSIKVIQSGPYEKK